MRKEGKYLLGLALLIFTIFSACKKDADTGDTEQMIQEHEEIIHYADSLNLTGEFTESGLYYQIIDSGGVNRPNLSSYITVTYNGYYLDGTYLDSGAFFSGVLGNLIEGWKEGIPLIGTGGKIKLIIPSHLAYDSGVIVFDVELHSFSK